MADFFIFNAKTNNSLLLTEKNNNTAALIGINLYSVLILYLFTQFLLFVYYVYL